MKEACWATIRFWYISANRFQIIRLGPKDIIRFIYPIEDIREEKADMFTKERMKLLEARARGE